MTRKLRVSRKFGPSLCALLAAALLVGCSSDSNESAIQQAQVPQTTVEMIDGTTLEVVANHGQAVSLRTSDGQVVPFEHGVAIVGEQLVIRAPDGRLEAYRQPQAINSQLDQLPYVYLKTGSLEKVVTHGCKGEPYVDPADGKLCWSAMVCRDPACANSTLDSAAQPKLFIHEIRGVAVRSDGRLNWWGARMEDINSRPICPVCGGHADVKLFEPPEASAQKEALAEELARVRAARDRW